MNNNLLENNKSENNQIGDNKNSTKESFKRFLDINRTSFMALFILLGLFLLAVTVSTVIDVQNKIREGEYIGREIGTITVSESGEVYAKPDLALINFSVITEAKTVAEAMADNTKKMNNVIASVKIQGIEDKDLKTISFNIYPRYEWYEKTEAYPQGKRVLVGYEVRQTLQVKIRDMEKIGKIIEEATDAGANQVGDLQLTIDKQDELKKQAREQAIEKAKAKAEELASQLGVDLVGITDFSEGVSVPYYYDVMKEAVGMGGGGVTPQIETGENKIEVRVSITYQIE